MVTSAEVVAPEFVPDPFEPVLPVPDPVEPELVEPLVVPEPVEPELLFGLAGVLGLAAG